MAILAGDYKDVMAKLWPSLCIRNQSTSPIPKATVSSAKGW